MKFRWTIVCGQNIHNETDDRGETNTRKRTPHYMYRPPWSLRRNSSAKTMEEGGISKININESKVLYRDNYAIVKVGNQPQHLFRQQKFSSGVVASTTLYLKSIWTQNLQNVYGNAVEWEYEWITVPYRQFFLFMIR